ncbi:extracellular solute-binding protein [Chloroflexi bacterium TSY]|nr:extracellular solute-binding protein [Chloroflexi bacterium TSY]
MSYTKRLAIGLVLVLILALANACVPAQQAATSGDDVPAAAQESDGPAGDFVVEHYFGGFGGEYIEQIVDDFIAMYPNVNRVESPVDHEEMKTQILAQLAGGNPPDVFSYWAGARVQFVVDGDRLQPIDDIWEANNMDEMFPPAVVENAATYDGEKYLVPLTLHWVGFFYNKALFEQVGAEVPQTWDELVAVAEAFKATDIPAFALGSIDRWPGQFWFDMILLRTAGNEYRTKLMNGEASYTDDEVVRAFGLWKELVDAGYFYPDANAYNWDDAANFVGNGEAGMTLMGTWISGHLKDGLEKVPGEDYDYFAFPIIDEDVPHASLGPIDGFVVPRDAANPEAAKAFVTYLTDPDVQLSFALGAGNLAPSLQADTSQYDVVTAAIAGEIANDAVFAFNYDLATPPPVAEVGLNAFSEFMNDPDDFMAMLERVQEDASAAFAELE